MSITRRETLRLGGAALGALAVPGWAAGATRTTQAAGVTPASEVALELVAATGPSVVAGQTATLWTYNGTFPGPLLRWREGDRIRLRLVNELAESTNLHLHGLHLPAAIDDPFLDVPPGGSATYAFDVPSGAAGTYWYHPHMHGRVARQLFAGLAGAIVVDGPSTDVPPLAEAEEHVLVLKDISLRRGTVAAHTPFDWMNGKEGDLVLVNGAWRPQLAPTRPLLRLRIVNAGNARYCRLLLEGHFLYQIATDGGLLESPVRRRSLLLAPGERAEVLVRLRRGGTFRLLNLPYDRGRGMGPHGHGMPMNLAPVLDAGGEPLLSIRTPHTIGRGALPQTLVPIERLAPAATAPLRRFVLSDTMMGGFTINGRRFNPDRVDERGRRGDLEVWEIENRGTMDHPFHLHTYSFQVLSLNGAAAEFAAWKDVVNLRPGDRVRLAVPLRDFGGRTVYHCHIAEHEDLGMMGVFEVT